MITKGYAAYVSNNVGLNCPKIRGLRLSTENFTISFSSFAKEHAYLFDFKKKNRTGKKSGSLYKLFQFTKNNYSDTSILITILSI